VDTRPPGANPTGALRASNFVPDKVVEPVPGSQLIRELKDTRENIAKILLWVAFYFTPLEPKIFNEHWL
jgi:hypothetical protein